MTNKKTAVHSAPDPMVMEALESLAESLRASYRPPIYARGIPADVHARLQGVAERLFQVSPWHIIATDSDIIAVDCPQLSISGAVLTIIGQMGESHGVLLYPSLEAYNMFRTAGFESGGRPSPEMLRGCSILSLNFEQTEELEPAILKEIRSYGIREIGSGVLPMTMCIADGHMRSATTHDLIVLTTIGEALDRFLREGAPVLREGAPLTLTAVLREFPGAPTVTLQYPHPRIDEIVDVDEEEPWDELVERFLISIENTGKSVDYCECADYLCTMFCYFRDEVQILGMENLCADDFESFLLNFYPIHVGDAIREKLTPLVGEILIAFAQYLRGEGFILESDFSSIKSCITSAQPQLPHLVAQGRKSTKRKNKNKNN